MAYTTSANVKLALGITDSARDDLVDMAVAAAIKAIDNATHRTFLQTVTAAAREFSTRRRTRPTRDGELLLVPDISTDTDLVVKVGDGTDFTTLDASAFELEPDDALDKGEPVTALLLIYGSWQLNRRVQITAKWGWATVPDDITQAALIQACRYFRRKDSPEGVAGSSDWGLVTAPRLDPDVRAIVDDYVLPGF